MMPWESWNARDAAWLRIERASARTIEEEMAARWWGKKDWGEARPSPYTVESTPSVPCAALASSLRRRSVCAKMCCYSTVTTLLSILEVLGVVWFAAGPATGRSEKPDCEFAHLFVRTERQTLRAHCRRSFYFQGICFAV